MYGWIIPNQIDTDARFPKCVMLVDPDSDAKRCGQPATGGRTILEAAICDTCFGLIA